jgi:tRNA U34 5-methylaminomethyl-2-thiouridine-forming methyltransferase MnmC
MKPVLPHAQLDWDDQGLPRSRVFDDVYFSDLSGLDETRYVFLEQNALRERFAALPAGGRLVIGETGFGTGLNFLCAWQLFEQQAAAGARLHFVSVEKYPLSAADLQRALRLWPELKPFADQLLAQYVAISWRNWTHRSTPGFSTVLPRRKTRTCGPPNCLSNWPGWQRPARPSAPSPVPAGCGAC